MELSQRPDYKKSEDLRKLRKYLCRETAKKPRNKMWIGIQVVASDEFYSDSNRAKENVKRIVSDERTPLARDQDRIVNTEADYYG